MDLPGPTQRQVRSSNRPHSNCATRLTVHSYRLREAFRARIPASISDIGGAGVSVQIDEMNNTGIVDDRLRLYSVVGSLNESNLAGLTGASQNGASQAG